MGPVKRAAYILWMRAKCKAKKRGLEFNLTRAFVELALANGYCSITGIEFDISAVRKKYSAFAASIDRKNPAMGYTELNCQIVCWIYNRAKGNGTHEEVLILAKAVLGTDYAF